MRPKKTDRALGAFGQALRAYRIATGMTQEQLAEAADLSTNFLACVERGEKNISLLNIIQLAHAVGVAPSALVQVLDQLQAGNG